MSQIKLIQKILQISFSRSAVSQIWRKDSIERKPIYFRCIQSQLWFVKYAKVQQGQSREKETILGKNKVYLSKFPSGEATFPLSKSTNHQQWLVCTPFRHIHPVFITASQIRRKDNIERKRVYYVCVQSRFRSPLVSEVY